VITKNALLQVFFLTDDSLKAADYVSAVWLCLAVLFVVLAFTCACCKRNRPRYGTKLTVNAVHLDYTATHSLIYLVVIFISLVLAVTAVGLNRWSKLDEYLDQSPSHSLYFGVNIHTSNNDVKYAYDMDCDYKDLTGDSQKNADTRCGLTKGGAYLAGIFGCFASVLLLVSFLLALKNFSTKWFVTPVMVQVSSIAQTCTTCSMFSWLLGFQIVANEPDNLNIILDASYALMLTANILALLGQVMLARRIARTVPPEWEQPLIGYNQPLNHNHMPVANQSYGVMAIPVQQQQQQQHNPYY